MGIKLEAGSRVLAIHRTEDHKVIGTTIEDHDFSPGSLSNLPISTGDSGIPDVFAITINCNKWTVYKLVKQN